MRVAIASSVRSAPVRAMMAACVVLLAAGYGCAADVPSSNGTASEGKQIAQEFQALKAKYANADGKTRSEAYKKWRESNAARLEKLKNGGISASSTPESAAAKAKKDAAMQDYLSRLPADKKSQMQQRLQMTQALQTLKEQNKNATPEQKSAAFKQWRKKNQAKIAAMQQSSSTSMPQSANTLDDPAKRQAMLKAMPADRRAEFSARLQMHDEFKALKAKYANADAKTRGEAYQKWIKERRAQQALPTPVVNQPSTGATAQ